MKKDIIIKTVQEELLKEQISLLKTVKKNVIHKYDIKTEHQNKIEKSVDNTNKMIHSGVDVKFINFTDDTIDPEIMKIIEDTNKLEELFIGDSLQIDSNS